MRSNLRHRARPGLQPEILKRLGPARTSVVDLTENIATPKGGWALGYVVGSPMRPHSARYARMPLDFGAKS